MKLNIEMINDPFLEPFLPVIRRRHEKSLLKELEFTNRKGRLTDLFNNYLYFGLHRSDHGWVFREWAPYATAIYILGESNEWTKREVFRLKRLDGGVWEVELSVDQMWHGMNYKLLVEWQGGSGERLPAYANRVVQDDVSKHFTTQAWVPNSSYQWKHKVLARQEHPLIYEVHIGMCMENRRVSTFNEFRAYVLPRIVDLGYNTIQLMGIQEHPYYGSFGYQVSNFFAVSSRFGTPDDLKHLIDAAHGFGIHVIMDLVHSHAVKNENEGLSFFAGDYSQYFMRVKEVNMRCGALVVLIMEKMK